LRAVASCAEGDGDYVRVESENKRWDRPNLFKSLGKKMEVHSLDGVASTIFLHKVFIQCGAFNVL
jgi:hypothetical protein